MKKLTKKLFATVVAIMFSTAALAGSFGVGVSGSLLNVQGSGEEKVAGVVDTNAENKANTSNDAYVGSVFAEYTFDGYGGFTFGVSHLPGSADVNPSTLQRKDIQTSVEGTAAEVTTAITRKAQASVENHMTYYAELPIHAGLYVKAGLVTMDVNTEESVAASKYANTEVDGDLWGIGYKNDTSGNWYYKVEATHTEFDTITLKSTGNATNSTANTIVADLDVTQATFALGYHF